MGRPRKPTIKELDDAIIECYIRPEGKQNAGQEVTTIEERKTIAARWSSGDYEYHRSIAAEREVLPIALLIASLIEAEHPIIMSSAGLMYNSLKCSVILLQIMYRQQPVSEPIDLVSFHRSLVERT